MKLKAYAKINLVLDIKGKRPDGYHLLSMIMQSIGLYDIIHLEKSDGIRVRDNREVLPPDEENIAGATARLFFETTGQIGGAEIFIEKNIPIAAGLGGGSADAAAVLVGLNSLYQSPLTAKQLRSLGQKIGADLPFCSLGGTALAEGTGEKLRVLPELPPCGILLVKPCQKTSTGEMYRRADLAEEIHHPGILEAIEALQKGDLRGLCARLGNSFESLWTAPEFLSAREDLRASGALGVSLSGSGPTVFGIFESLEKAERAAETLKKRYPDTFATIPQNVGWEII